MCNVGECDVGVGVGHGEPDEVRILQHEYCHGISNVGYDLTIFDDDDGCGNRGDGSVGNGGCVRRADVSIQRGN